MQKRKLWSTRSTATIPLWVFTLLTTLSHGQYLNERFDFPDPEAANSGYGIVTNGEVLVCIQGATTADFLEWTALSKFSLEGDLLEQLDIGDVGWRPNPSGYDSLKEHPLGFTVQFHQTELEDIEHYMHRIEIYDYDFQLLGTYEEEFFDVEVAMFDHVVTADGGFIAVGRIEEEGQISGIRLIKVSPDFELVWEKSYPGFLTSDGIVVSQIATDVRLGSADQIIVGARRTYELGFLDCSIGQFQNNNMVIQFDSEGNQEWEFEWDDCFASPLAPICVTPDDNILVARSQYDPDTEGLEANWFRLHLSELSNEGVLITDASVSTVGLNYAPTQIDWIDENQILIGGRRWLPAEGERQAFLVSLNSFYEEQWDYTYYFEESTESVIIDFCFTPVGIYGSGHTLDSPGYPTQDCWIIGVDWEGCIDLGCTNSVSEQEIEDTLISIGQDLTGSQLSVTSKISLGQLDVFIYNSLGQVVMSGSIDESVKYSPWVMNTEGLDKGVYYVGIASPSFYLGSTLIRH